MRRDVVRAVCALAVTIAAVLPATAGASSPQVEIKAGRAACGAAAYCISPATLTVPAGATVLWHNLTGAPLPLLYPGGGRTLRAGVQWSPRE